MANQIREQFGRLAFCAAGRGRRDTRMYALCHSRGSRLSLVRTGSAAWRAVVWRAVVWAAVVWVTAARCPAGEASTSLRGLAVDAVLSRADSVDIPARESGVLAEMRVEEGQRVEVGQVLAKIDDQTARYEHARALLELEVARREASNDAKLRVAEKAAALAHQDLERGKRLNLAKAGTLSAEEMEERQLKADAADLEIDNIRNEMAVARTTEQLKQNEVAAAEYRMQRRQIVTRVSGFVEHVDAHLGEWVEPGTTVFRIVRDDRLFAEALVPLSGARGNLTGHTVTVVAETVAGQQVTLTGRINYFSPHVGALDGDVRIRAELLQPEETVAAGQRVVMHIHDRPDGTNRDIQDELN